MLRQKTEIEKTLRRFNVLANQLLMANLHLYYFMRLDEAQTDYYSELPPKGWTGAEVLWV